MEFTLFFLDIVILITKVMIFVMETMLLHDQPVVRRLRALVQDLKAKRSNRIAEAAGYDSLAAHAERAGTYVAKQLGTNQKWSELNKTIWSVISSRKDYAFHLSDLDSVAQAVSCESNEVLAILALLSRPSSRMLKMEFRSGPDNGVEVMPSDFTRKLTDWWKKKSMSDEEWRAWASRTNVKWIPRQS